MVIPWISDVIRRSYLGLKRQVRYFGGISALVFYSQKDYFLESRGRHLANEIMVTQIYFTGNMALKIIFTVAFALGAITVMQLFTQLSKVGALEYMGDILNVVIVRELGPVITAFVVISRSGSAIAAEIATMMVNDEINAMEMLGINTLKLIVFPRIAGMVISLLMLTIYFMAIGIIGGFLVGNLVGGIAFSTLQSYVMSAIGPADIGVGLFKSLIFGLFISGISIFHGFQAFVSTQIPQVTTKAVVSCILFLFVSDIIITVMFSL